MAQTVLVCSSNLIAHGDSGGKADGREKATERRGREGKARGGGGGGGFKHTLLPYPLHVLSFHPANLRQR